MNQELKIFCIIPAYNEEEGIAGVVNSVKPLVDEVVVVDDGSNDKTYELAKQQGATVLRHILNRGQGAALQTGNEYALAHGADILAHFDADGQFIANEIQNVTRPIISGKADVVFGSRFLEKKCQMPWLKKNIFIPIAHLVNKIMIGQSLTDPQNGFRAMSAEAVRKITIEQDGMAHCSEIMAKVFSAGFRVKEVPITVIYHDFGQKFSGGVKIVRDLFLTKLIN